MASTMEEQMPTLVSKHGVVDGLPEKPELTWLDN